jgi:hypothetical protein
METIGDNSSKPAARKAPAPRHSLRYLTPAGARATQYEEVTVHTQWSPSNYATQGWFSRCVDGRPPWTEGSTRLKCRDWWRYRDPAERWFRNYAESQAAAEDAIELATEGAARMGLLARIDPAWLRLLGRHYAAYRYPEYGLFLALCYAQREALSDVAAGPLVFQSLDKDRHSQAIALYMMDLETAVPGFSDSEARAAWTEDPIWQPTRRYVERLIACRDWGEIAFAIDLLYEPIAATLFTRELLARCAPFHGDTVTPVILATVESDRAIAARSMARLFACIIEDAPANREVMDGWIATWAPQALECARALRPLFDAAAANFEESFARVIDGTRALLSQAGIESAVFTKLL